MAADDDWPVVVGNLRKGRREWAQLTRVLGREGKDARTLGQIYMVVIQLVMLYRSETWMTTPHIGRVLGGFHHKVARKMMGRQPWKGRNSVWTYPPKEDAMAEAGLQEVETYISRLQNTVTQFIVTRPIMDLCLAAERIPGTQVSRRWWEQGSVDVEGMRTAAWEAERTEGREETDITETATY